MLKDKNELRAYLKEVRRNISGRELKEDAVTDATLFEIKSIGAKSVIVYLSMGSELSTKAIIRALFGSIKIYVPFTENGIITPLALKTPDTPCPDGKGNIPWEFTGERGNPETALVPILGFSSSLYRIGYGAGCYDGFFKTYTKCGRIGLAFSEQYAEFAPEAHDERLNSIITPDGIRRIK